MYCPTVPLSKVSATRVATGTMVTCWLCTASAFPALSVEKNCTVVFPRAVTWNGAEYTVLDVVGVEPSVV